ncbi:hypothetical protein V1504DRAFT_383918, partial [Lipomyces starkeyi]
LVNTPKPTVDPTCPLDAKRAKQISRMLNETVELVDLGDEDVIDLIEGRQDAGDEEHDDDDSHRSSHSPSIEPPTAPRAKRSDSGEEASGSRKKSRANVQNSLVSYLAVRQDRERKSDVIMMYRTQIDGQTRTIGDLRQECRLRESESTLYRELSLT